MRIYRIDIESSDESDVEFIRERAQGAVEDVVLEYEDKFDGEVIVTGQFVDVPDE